MPKSPKTRTTKVNNCKTSRRTAARCRRSATSAAIVGGDQLRVGAGARYIGERAGNAVNDFDLPSYTWPMRSPPMTPRLDGQRVKFQLNVKNLFDRTYYTSAASRFFVSMGDSRQVTLSSTLEF